MSASKLPEYVFRGTTIGYKGNKNSLLIPYTSTSKHPVKALWFALECYLANPDMAVVYISRTDKLKDIEIGFNHFRAFEDEVGFNTPPLEFYPYCEGYIHVIDFQVTLRSLDIECNQIARLGNLTRLCKGTPPVSVKKMESLMDMVLPMLKK